MLYKNIIFIHIPKTGGNSFQKELILNKNYEGSITVTGNQDGYLTFYPKYLFAHYHYYTCFILVLYLCLAVRS